MIMSSITVSLIVFACIFGGALLGIFLHTSLPQHHLAADSKDIVKLGMGLVGTMAARILDQMWSKDGASSAAPAAPSGGEILYERIQALSPKNDMQRSLQGTELS